MLSFVYIVIPEPENVTIKGLPALVKDGTTVVLTCAVDEIRPEADYIYWRFDGKRYNGTLGTTLNNDGTFGQQNFLELR